VATSRKVIVKTNACVSCPTCGYEIIVLTGQSLPREFSVLCPNCGGRKLYRLDQLHDRKLDAESKPIPARVRFGTKPAMDRAIDPNQAVGSAMSPKSRLSELTSWLLQ